MARFVALYTRPDDVEGFEEHYRTVHVPLMERWPDVESLSVTRFVATPRGTEPDYHLMADVRFSSDAAMQEAMQHASVREAGKDAMSMVERFGTKVTLLLGTDF